MMIIDTVELGKNDFKQMLYNELQEKCNELIYCKTKLVDFSIFEDCGGQDDEWIVKAPNIKSIRPVIEGAVVFCCDNWRLIDYNEGQTVYSKAFFNPTWRDIINAANDMLRSTCDYGLFLEGLSLEEKVVNGCKLVNIKFGS